jgi:hypothetical protein
MSRATVAAMSCKPYGPASYAANIPCVSMSAIATACLPSSTTIARARIRGAGESPGCGPGQ